MPLFSETNVGVRERNIKKTPIPCEYINLLPIHLLPQEMGYRLHCRWMFSHSLWTKNLTFKKTRLRDNSLYSQLERMPRVKRQLPNGVFPCVAMTPVQETKHFMMRLGCQHCLYISCLPYPSSSSMSKTPVSFSGNRGKRYRSQPF